MHYGAGLREVVLLPDKDGVKVRCGPLANEPRFKFTCTLNARLNLFTLHSNCSRNNSGDEKTRLDPSHG